MLEAGILCKIMAQKSADLSGWGVQTQAVPLGAGVQLNHNVCSCSDQQPIYHPESFFRGMGTMILFIRYKAGPTAPCYRMK